MANYYGFKKTILKLFKVTFIEKNTKSVFSKYYFLKNSYLRNLLKFFDLKIARKPFFFNYYSLKKKYFLEMSRKKKQTKNQTKISVLNTVLLKNAHFRYCGTISKKLAETTKIPCSQKNLSHFRSFVEQFCGKKKLNDHRQFFAVILIEKLGENHRVSNPVVKKMS